MGWATDFLADEKLISSLLVVSGGVFQGVSSRLVKSLLKYFAGFAFCEASFTNSEAVLP